MFSSLNLGYLLFTRPSRDVRVLFLEKCEKSATFVCEKCEIL